MTKTLMSAKPECLYHFTCGHAKRDIGTGPRALLLPHLHPWLHKKLVWLTDEPEPDRGRTGLTSTYISCDRMEHRYVVTDLEHCRRWSDSAERASLSPAKLEAFEVREGGEHADTHQWWIADVPISARFDRSWKT